MNPATTSTEDPLLHFYHKVHGLSQQPKLPENNLVPTQLGKGYVSCLWIEEGICAGFYDLEFLEDQRFSFPANNNDGAEQLFRLVFSLGDIDGVSNGHENPFWITKNKTSFYSINFNRIAFLPARRRYRSVDLIFSKKWMELNFQTRSEKIGKLIRNLSKKKEPTMLLEHLDKSSYLIAHQVSAGLADNSLSLITVKAEIYTLLNHFLQRTMQRSARNINKNQSLYYDQIKEIEKSLSKYYTEELPSISELARQFNISASTLKRHFKNIFNKSIYDYYLEQKMALGMAMLEEKKSSVSEVAYRLGYHKVNSFSKIFKKHFGILPSQCE